ncbi:MAG TPA: alpha-amylase family glycosyl hydrolase [Bacillota bacterium]|nr:alpha-amylase family glycosyl hydrolase [Bacillota bacterium]
MIESVFSPEFEKIVMEAKLKKVKQVTVNGATVTIDTPFPSPEDWRDLPVYCIMPDRFNGPLLDPNYKLNQEWNRFTGGTFKGITEKLDYLKDLGVGAIWVTPVFKNRQDDSGTYHGYGVQDFLEVDPRFGTKRNDIATARRELHELIDQAHARGMYIIMDIIINHSGDVFAYCPTQQCSDPNCDYDRDRNLIAKDIWWRKENGDPEPNWKDGPANCPPNAAVWPRELRKNECFHRVGQKCGGEVLSDFFNLKDFNTALTKTSPQGAPDYRPVWDTLIKICQYWIAEADIDGARLDTFKHIEKEFGRSFCNSVREYALSIGKKNFLMFAEVKDSMEEIAKYIGKPYIDPGDIIGVESAINFPWLGTLPEVLKGAKEPANAVYTFEAEKKAFSERYTTHGEASRYLYNLLDGHDEHWRFYYQDPDNKDKYNDQLTLGVACLYSWLGIPILYYGTEQGLHGTDFDLNGQPYGSKPDGKPKRSEISVREFLSEKPGAFDVNHPFYKQIQEIASLRASEPALRYGRQYHREIAGKDGDIFGISPYKNGVLAYSRILNDEEIVIVLNTNTEINQELHIVVDYTLNNKDLTYKILYSNKGQQAIPPGPKVVTRSKGSVTIYPVGGGVTDGPLRSITVTLQPMECQIVKGMILQ